MKDSSPLRVVAIGGGNGLSSVLQGLKHYARPTGPSTPTLDITAIVTVTETAAVPDACAVNSTGTPGDIETAWSPQ